MSDCSVLCAIGTRNCETSLHTHKQKETAQQGVWATSNQLPGLVEPLLTVTATSPLTNILYVSPSPSNHPLNVTHETHQPLQYTTGGHTTVFLCTYVHTYVRTSASPGDDAVPVDSISNKTLEKCSILVRPGSKSDFNVTCLAHHSLHVHPVQCLCGRSAQFNYPAGI